MNHYFRLITLAAGLALSVSAGARDQAPVVEVYKSATCGCCSKWVEHLKQNGFEVRAYDVPDPGALRQRFGMPDKYGACHTAKVGGYVVEGHVPAKDIKRLLAEKPKAVGISVPSMPPGSPGMESPKPIPYDTFLVKSDGSAVVYARH